MKMFSDCSGPCETCKCFVNGCLAGHGDDDYEYASPEWLVMRKSEENRKKAEDSV